DPLADQTVSVTTLDNDVAAFTIVQSGGTTQVSETVPSTDTFTVVLNVQPLGNVVFTVTSGDLSEATVSPSPLTFTPGDWNVPKTVTVSGVDDAVADGSQVSIVTVSVDDASSDNGFDPLPDQTVSVTTLDNDDAIAPTVDIVDVTPDPRNTPASDVLIAFSEPVLGFDLADVSLRRNGQIVPLAGATLEGTGAAYTLRLVGAAALKGNYLLTLTAAGSGIADVAGNPLAADAQDAWRMTSPWHNVVAPLNTDGFPGVAPLDVLVIVNEVNNRGFSDPITGLLPPVSQTLGPPPFVDANDDGFVTAIDALLVINFLNFGEGEGESPPAGRSAAAQQETADRGKGEQAPAIEYVSPAGNSPPGRSRYPQPAEFVIPDALLDLLATDVGRRVRGRRNPR
ncbi:MAG TPA: dockerin type I domain-containing protein, partial [Pirellulaceae bacterium]|nr:dockerin type I domain-containing protein [Pirellulaceae bacterium]